MAISTWTIILSKMSMTTLIGITLATLFLGQILAGTVIGQWLGITQFKAGPFIQLLFYFAGALGILYTVMWIKPGTSTEGISSMLTAGLFISIFCWVLAMFVIPLIPGLGALQTAFPMQPDISLPPLAIIPLP